MAPSITSVTRMLILGFILSLPAEAAVQEREALVVTDNVTLDPARTYGAIVVKGSNLTIDGRGAWLLGPSGKSPKDYQGAAISADGASNVTIRNVKAKGWETGLKVSRGSGWTIEGCDFSDNFHDPEFDWGENGRRGGIVLEGVSKSLIRKNRANRVWDACVLVDSDENQVEDNDFSHASNTCLKLGTSSRNRVARNNLSYGLRIRPGEVHARDSAGVLIESGSNHNIFTDNDCTHGGDGVFIRVLNGWVSTGNVFERNDASYANNNGFEAWAPRNVYRHNTSNHCSYGFWLGASDQTLVERNTASHNGRPDGFHNSPHLPGDGHAGIVFMFGPSSHTIVRGNRCEDNQGAGIALVGDLDPGGPKWKAFHWIIEQNQLIGNRWGIYAKNANWVRVSGNTFRDNTEKEIHQDGGVSRWITGDGPPNDATSPPVAKLDGPSRLLVGERAVFSAKASTDPNARPLSFAWDLGDGTTSDKPSIEHEFKFPGFYRLGLTVTNGAASDLAWRNLYVADRIEEIGTEGQADEWTGIDPQSRVAFSNDAATCLAGRSSVFARVDPYSGNPITLRFPKAKPANLSLEGKTELILWIKAINEGTTGWQGPNPIVTLHETDTRATTFTPRTDLLAHPPYNETREGWLRLAIPLAGSPEWPRTGGPIATLNFLTLTFDSWETPPLRIWIDGLGVR